MAQPCEEPICSEDSRDSNVGPSNLDVDASHDVNCKDETLDAPDICGVIRRHPRAESNPLLCNLKDQESTRDTTEAVVQILNGMLIKIPEHQIECSTIRGIGSHRITRFDLVETEVIQERIKAIMNGSKSGRRNEILADNEVSVYDEGTKEYIESNRLLDYISEFLWKAREKADRLVPVNGLNETKPSSNYDTYYRGRIENGEYMATLYTINVSGNVLDR